MRGPQYLGQMVEQGSGQEGDDVHALQGSVS